MIYRITIENFYSIADQQELIFKVADNAPDLPCFRSSPSDRDIRLPTVIGFFGANASGKTTVLRAITSLVVFLCHSFEFNNINDHRLVGLFQPYRHKKWWGKPSKILIEFDSQLNEDSPSAIFRYELHISHQTGGDIFNNKKVYYEALSYAPKGKFRRLFERHEQRFHFGDEFGIPNSADPRVAGIRPNASVISTLVQFNHTFSSYFRSLIYAIKTNVFGIWGDYQKEMKQDLLSTYVRDKSCLERLNRELRRFDIGLESMSIEQRGQELIAKFHHIGLNSPIFYQEESKGTQRFIEIFWRLFYALEFGSVAIIDELDIELHPLLLPEIFRWFNDPKRNQFGAQLLFTAHNVAVLDDLKKEQVYFTEKLMGEPSHVYGARDIKGLRREPSLMKKYLSGELGAIPHIG